MERSRAWWCAWELAGIEPESLSLSLAGQELVVAGPAPTAAAEDIRRFIYLEMGFGAFERCFLLPIPVDPQGVRPNIGMASWRSPAPEGPTDSPDSGKAGRFGIIEIRRPHGQSKNRNSKPRCWATRKIRPLPRVLPDPAPDLARCLDDHAPGPSPAQKLVQEALFQDKIIGDSGRPAG